MRASKTQGDNARNCTVRTFEHRTQVDLAAYAQGGEPQTADEIAIDRVFATNNDVSMGDTVALNGVEFHVVGIMTLADNQALFQSNSDFTVNTLSFGVARSVVRGIQGARECGFSAELYLFISLRRPRSFRGRPCRYRKRHGEARFLRPMRT